jgi:hypothetical protein
LASAGNGYGFHHPAHIISGLPIELTCKTIQKNVPYAKIKSELHPKSWTSPTERGAAQKRTAHFDFIGVNPVNHPYNQYAVLRKYWQGKV